MQVLATIKRKWFQSAAYWSVVVALMFADGSLGWDDVFIFFVALAAYVRLIFRSTP